MPNSEITHAIDELAEKFYNIVQQRFNESGEPNVPFSEIMDSQKAYYNKLAVDIMILDNTAWKYFHKNENRNKP